MIEMLEASGETPNWTFGLLPQQGLQKTIKKSKNGPFQSKSQSNLTLGRFQDVPGFLVLRRLEEARGDLSRLIQLEPSNREASCTEELEKHKDKSR